jgi:glucarate dehydratase
MATKLDTRIADVRVTPIAFYDPPLLNNAGCHQPWALRSIIEVETEGGVVGLGESYGSQDLVGGVERAADALRGLDVKDINGLFARVAASIEDTEIGYNTGAGSTVLRVGGAIEVAMWDAYGKSTNQRVCDLMGGQVRESVPFSAYLFYKFANHQHEAGPDVWGEVLTPEQLVEEARMFKEIGGFDAIKLKAGILPPEEELAGLEALKAAFPNSPLRIDPNGGWTVDTTLKLLPRLEGLIEYLEDPTVGIDGNAQVQAQTDIPLATNMYVVQPKHLPENAIKDGFRVILSDHHYWGGLQKSRELAAVCRVWGLGLSMHSNSHLGISLAAMTHLAAATPNLTYGCDTHYPWQIDDVVAEGRFEFKNGGLTVPEGPGLGVTLDRSELKRLHQNYLDCGYTSRDDEIEMKKYWQDWDFARPAF